MTVNRIKPAKLSYDEQGRLYNQDFDDIYFQPEQGVEESSYVFLKMNDLHGRFQSLDDGARFRIAELGFGSGLNFLLTVKTWQETAPKEAQLYFVSFEKHPILKKDLEKIYQYWPELSEQAEALLAQYPEPVAGFHKLSFGSVHLLLGFGDVAELLPHVKTQVDAWFLDGFAPAKNPDMWAEDIFAHMARLTVKDGTYATFTAAGAVRRGLEATGFDVAKEKGFGKKRDMLVGRYLQGACKKEPAENKAIVIGAGVAGCAVAYALAEKGYHVTVLEQEAGVGHRASGNKMGIVYPRLTAAPSDFGRFYQHAFCHTIRLLDQLGTQTGWQKRGVAILNHDADLEKKNKGVFKTSGFPDTMLSYDDADELSKRAGLDIVYDGLFYPEAGFVEPPKFCQALIEAFPEQIHFETGVNVESYHQAGNLWQVLDAQGQVLAEAPYLIVASGSALQHEDYSGFLPLRYVRGQVTSVPANKTSEALNIVLSHQGYVAPSLRGRHYVGATFEKLSERADQAEMLQEDNIENLDMLHRYVPSMGLNEAVESDMEARAGVRTTTIDHLPVIGRCAVEEKWHEDFAGLRHGKFETREIDLENAPYYDGLYLCGALGSHGLTTAPFAAEMIAAMITGDPVPAPIDVVEAVHPGRFILRALKRGGS